MCWAKSSPSLVAQYPCSSFDSSPSFFEPSAITWLILCTFMGFVSDISSTHLLDACNVKGTLMISTVKLFVHLQSLTLSLFKFIHTRQMDLYTCLWPQVRGPISLSVLFSTEFYLRLSWHVPTLYSNNASMIQDYSSFDCKLVLAEVATDLSARSNALIIVGP